MVVAELQDSLMMVMHDLSRLEGLLSHTMDNLMLRFDAANQELSHASLASLPALEDVRSTLRSAVTELQFQDMASQLIVHTTKVLRGGRALRRDGARAPQPGDAERDGRRLHRTFLTYSLFEEQANLAGAFHVFDTCRRRLGLPCARWCPSR
jgi:hypothetical protein